MYLYHKRVHCQAITGEVNMAIVAIIFVLVVIGLHEVCSWLDRKCDEFNKAKDEDGSDE